MKVGKVTLLGAFLCLFGLSSVLFFYGYKVGTEVENSQRSVLYYKLHRAEELLYELKKRLLGASQPGVDGPEAIAIEIIDTNLLRVTFRKLKVSDARGPYDGVYDNTGGAITQVGDEILLLDPKGRFFWGNSLEQGFRGLDIQVPSTNHHRYEAYMTDPEYKNAGFRKAPLRYNDLEYFNTGAKRGLLLSYSQFDLHEPCYRNIVDLLEFGAEQTVESLTVAAEDWKPLYRSQPCLPLIKSGRYALAGEMAGGKLLFQGPSTVYLANGDFDHFDVAQDDEADYGKMIAIDLVTGAKRTIAKGLRNTKGMTLDSQGQFLEVEMGPRGGDELNIIKEGENYGWPRETFGTTYSGTPIPESISFGRHDHYAKPFFTWTPSIAPSGILELSEFHELWDGDLIISGLIGRSLYRMRVMDGQVAYVEAIATEARIRDILQFGKTLVLLTDDVELVFMTVENIPTYDDLTARFFDRNTDILPDKFQATISACQQCHDWFGNDNAKAPNLQKVYGDRIGATRFQAYSQAMKQADKLWNDQHLKDFLLDPQSVVPGTVMPNPGVESEQEVEQLVRFLKYLDRIH